jgi:SAM-dependent methyltransferase
MIRAARVLNRQVRALSKKTHGHQSDLEWNRGDSPEWYDHYLDLHFQWHKNRIPFWVERGIFNLLAIKDEARLLELCCGDGFNSYHFYSARTSSVTAVDFDPEVIAHAKKNNQAENIAYSVADIRNGMPGGLFDNIVWDAAIEHFTKDEIASIMREIKERLGQNGVLSGYTILELDPGHGLRHHETEFTSKEDLMRFFTPHFKNVKVFETMYSSRHNLYFFASDSSALPFDSDWSRGISNTR